MNLSKSKFCNAVQCNKMLWLENNKPEEMGSVASDAVLDNGNYVHEVARDLLGKYQLITFNSNLEEMIKETKKYLTQEKITLAEASFVFENNFCSVDLLKKDGNVYEIYEVKGATKVKDIFIWDLAYQYYVLSKQGYFIKKCNIVTLNSSYVRKDTLDLQKMFCVEDYTDVVIKMQNEIETKIKEINNYMKNEKEPQDDIDNKCFKPYTCPFFTYCTKHLEKPNVFDIRRIYNSQKIKLYQKGLYRFKDLLNTSVNDMMKQQIEYELYNKDDYINQDKIKMFLNTLSKPLYFLDFETFASPIPKYEMSSPYEQIPFQYSLHYMDGDELKHKEFLAEAGTDPRRKLAESLVRDIPLDVCTLAYNMSFEKNVIKKLAMLYPDLAEHLLNIHDHIKDLMIPFKDRYYYNKDMQGSYSIKYVLPALFPNEESLNYHNLDLIHNGSEAMNAFADLEGKSKEELEYIRERLLRYCELDTYAMVKIYQKLNKVIK